MTTFMAIMTVLLGVLLLVVTAMRPRRTTMSQFELHRRIEAGDKQAAEAERRESLLSDVQSLQRIISALLLVVVTILCVTILGWLVGVIVAVLIALEYATVSRWPLIQTQAQKLYEHLEPHVLQLIERYPKIIALVRNVKSEEASDYRLESREQLMHLVSQSGNLLTVDEKHLMANALEFDDQLVSSIMTPSSMMDCVKKSELLGPLVLDDLHKTGHSRFPVIDGDINHVVGVLHIRDLLMVSAGKHSTTAEKSMEPRVFYIHQDQTLSHALAAFLKTHHHLFVVVNEFRETVGLLSLEDVIEALLGRKIIDEFDAHEDLRAVAARNPRGNNHPDQHTDV